MAPDEAWIRRQPSYPEDYEICLKDEDGAIQVVLTVAHLDHTPEHCEDENLMAMCQRCHNVYDEPHRRKTRRETRERLQIRMEL